ncbi:MAG: hypothetical protein VYD57_14365 [Pseudomonadota bacterium]|nr:hypothetical protein [Pseudomonadota bacterium]
MAGNRLVAERLMDLLLAEIGTAEAVFEENGPEPEAESRSKGTTRRSGAKERIETIGLLARTLEKLIDLKRLEANEGPDGQEGPETERLRDELLRRLKLMERRRLDAALKAMIAQGAPADGG